MPLALGYPSTWCYASFIAQKSTLKMHQETKKSNSEEVDFRVDPPDALNMQ